ncbi:hypothetical protein VNO77_42392 [Canavalia gladiata]|uniref:Uncharacterized protein n=1 Tax=Canavalia gladiata TaxID=3824 RepID=A0AAN9JUD3_CANGL
MLENKPREIKLLCPSLSKVTQLIAWGEQKIDLGSISWAFGLDPSTLRLNGHFISRGVDLISSSVTWNSLLSFFSSKGLSTGKDYRDALVVTGKLCKVGNKRGHDLQDVQNGIGEVMEGENADRNRGIQQEVVNLLKNKRLREGNSGKFLNAQSCKRKQLLEDVNLFKKLKLTGDKLDTRDKVDDLSGSISRSQFTCSYANKNLKRIRDEEAIVVANYKRIR